MNLLAKIARAGIKAEALQITFTAGAVFGAACMALVMMWLWIAPSAAKFILAMAGSGL